MTEHDPLLVKHIEDDAEFKKKTAERLDAIDAKLEPITKVFTESKWSVKVVMYVLGLIALVGSALNAIHMIGVSIISFFHHP